jgi:hypothetical protein
MLNDRENILSALREKPLKVFEIMKRANGEREGLPIPAIENARRRFAEIRHSQGAMAHRMSRRANNQFFNSLQCIHFRMSGLDHH